jgi:hypothetical protein
MIDGRDINSQTVWAWSEGESCLVHADVAHVASTYLAFAATLAV